MSKGSFAVEDRVDDIPQPWEFQIQDGVEDQEIFWDIAKKLFRIPVKPLPDPLVSTNKDWRKSMNVGEFDFTDTWEAYLDVLGDFGTIYRSEFKYIRQYEDKETTLPRAKHGAEIITRLSQSRSSDDLYLYCTIYGTGYVYSVVLDERRHKVAEEMS